MLKHCPAMEYTDSKLKISDRASKIVSAINANDQCGLEFWLFAIENVAIIMGCATRQPSLGLLMTVTS